MSNWRAKASGLFRAWRASRYRRRAADDATRDQRQADELERIRKGADGFSRGAGGI
jgi:hypothetical protein